MIRLHRPCRAGGAVEHVAPQTVAFRDARMIEIALDVAVQTDGFHHPARSPIADRRHRDDSIEVRSLEAESERKSGRLARVAAAPMRGREAPADFDRRRE